MLIDLLPYLWGCIAVSLILACVLTRSAWVWLLRVVYVAAGLFSFTFTLALVLA